MLSHASTYINFVKVDGRTTKIVSISFFFLLLVIFFNFVFFIWHFHFPAAAPNLVSVLIFCHTFSPKLLSLRHSFTVYVHVLNENTILCTMTPLADTLRFNVCECGTVVNLNGKHRTIHMHTANGCVRPNNFDTFNKNSVAAKSAVSSLARTHSLFVCLNELSRRKSVAERQETKPK